MSDNPLRRLSGPEKLTYSYLKSQGIIIPPDPINGVYPGWHLVCCPFHGDRTLRVNITTGAFCCKACGARGKNMLEFHMMLHHRFSFLEMAVILNMWEDNHQGAGNGNG
ncbi:MAG: CHC2 zinc finger domain-containing protein [Sphaerochaetaceae bacterium]